MSPLRALSGATPEGESSGRRFFLGECEVVVDAAATGADAGRRALSAKAREALADSAFAYVGPDGERHYPCKHADGSLDAEHVRKGIQWLPTSDLHSGVKAKIRAKLVAAAKSLGIEVSGERSVDVGRGVDVGRRVDVGVRGDVGVGVSQDGAVGRNAVRSAGAPAPEPTRAVLPCELRVVDEGKREIEVCATSEAVDTFGADRLFLLVGTVTVVRKICLYA